jgi:hypothetical protein
MDAAAEGGGGEGGGEGMSVGTPVAAELQERRRKKKKKRWWEERSPDREESDDDDADATPVAAAAAATRRSPSRSRRKLNDGGRSGGSSSSSSGPRRDRDIAIIQDKLGQYQHHGTGNPLAVRSPATPRGLAVENLATIIREGVLGQPPTGSSPELKTERGKLGSFWTNKVRRAGGYGWTGLLLPENTDTSHPLPIELVAWFLVEDEQELDTLRRCLMEDDDAEDKWRSVQDRVITVSGLAERLMRGGDVQTDYHQSV